MFDIPVFECYIDNGLTMFEFLFFNCISNFKFNIK